MTPFITFDDYLQQEYSDNYWADDAITYAQELVQQLTPADWSTLAQTWRDRPSAWQYRCAQVLSWGNVEFAVPVLVDMLQTPDAELTVTAGDALRDIAPENVAAHLSPGIIDHLQSVSRQQGGISARVIDALLAKIR